MPIGRGVRADVRGALGTLEGVRLASSFYFPSLSFLLRPSQVELTTNRHIWMIQLVHWGLRVLLFYV